VPDCDPSVGPTAETTIMTALAVSGPTMGMISRSAASAASRTAYGIDRMEKKIP